MTASQAPLDTRAIELSTQALTLIQMHIQSCDDRYGMLIKRFDASAEERNDMRRTINRWMSSVIGLLVLSLGYYLVTFGLPGDGRHTYTTSESVTTTVHAPERTSP